MFDIKLIRENLDLVKTGLTAKKTTADLNEILQKDKERRDILGVLEELRAQQNAANDEISTLIKTKQDPKPKIAAMKEISAKAAAMEPDLKKLEDDLHALLLRLPNLPHGSVPVGGMEANTVVRSWGEPKQFDFSPKTHVDIAETLDIIDFKRATKLSGANFLLYKGLGARLERALINFMLDVQTQQNGYKEIFPPFLVNTASMTGTGQLPKMAEDMYRLNDDELYLIPTAEVPVTNIHRDEILSDDELPIFYTAYSACFRREAGSYGKDTRGLMRVHQFNKVELVKFVKPETSYNELENLVGNAEHILQLLKLPYRVLMLASGDLSFAAAKCYDLEVHTPGLNKWLEASSCSNFEDFQARRANIRFKSKETKKVQFVHTLNGSGVATPRTMISIIENYQTADGGIIVPEVLRPYMGGLEKISK